MSKEKYESVWDAIEDDSVKREIYKPRLELMHLITQHIVSKGLSCRIARSLSATRRHSIERRLRILSTRYAGRLRLEMRPLGKHGCRIV